MPRASAAWHDTRAGISVTLWSGTPPPAPSRPDPISVMRYQQPAQVTACQVASPPAARTTLPSPCDPRRSRTSPPPPPPSPWHSAEAAPACRSRAHLQRDREVLRQQPHGESRVELARDHELFELLLRRVVHPGRRIQHVDHHRRIQPEALTDQQRLDADQEAAGTHQVVQRLHRLAGADRAGAQHRGPHRPQHRHRLSMIAGSPPTMIASSPVFARGTPPDTGASIMWQPSSITVRQVSA